MNSQPKTSHNLFSTPEGLPPMQWTWKFDRYQYRPTKTKFEWIHALPDHSGRVFEVYFHHGAQLFWRPFAHYRVFIFFNHHAYVPQYIPLDTRTNITVKVVKHIMITARIGLKHAKKASSFRVIEHCNQKVNNIMKINISPYHLQWEQYFIITVVVHNTTYPASLQCYPTDTFHHRLP